MKTLKLGLTTLLILLVGVLAVSTFLERLYGTEFAATNIYHTQWFLTLWMGLAVVSVFMLLRRQVWKRVAVGLLHVSFLVILLGAAVSFVSSSEGTLHLRQGSSADYFFEKGKEESSRLPFTLRLDSFRIVNYAGTMAPADYESHVVCTSGGKSRAHVISMNHTLDVEGYRFYQTSFDSDQQGTILTVSHDVWGTRLTYAGYLLFALSMLGVMLSRSGEYRKLWRHPLLQKRSLFALLLVCLPLSGMAREAVPTVKADMASRAARRQVVYEDRVMPFGALAHDLLRKVYGRGTYRGLSAEQVCIGWGMRPDAWKDQPMIKIKSGALRAKLGIKGKYAKMSELFDQGRYKLNDLVRTQGGTDAADKDVRELDEKVGLLIMLAEGRLVQMAPKAARVSEGRVEAELLLLKIDYTKWLFMICLTVGMLAFVALLWRMSHPQSHTATLRHAQRGFEATMWLALAIHTAGYALRWYVSGRIPMGNGYETMLFLSLAALGITAWAHRRYAFALPLGMMLSGFTLLVAHLAEMNPQISHLMPVLNSPILSLHVSVIMLAYALLAFTMLTGFFALMLAAAKQPAAEKSERLKQLTLFSRLLLYPAVFLLGCGIFLGAVWANISWGNYWSWDPKETWALITFLIYSIPLHQKIWRSLQNDKRYHLFMVLAFMSVLMTYFGVNYILGGLHSYA